MQKRAQLELNNLRGQCTRIRTLAKRTKPRHLWQQEAAVREKLRALDRLKSQSPRGWEELHRDYVALLEELSRRILADYNERRGTKFRFEEVVRGRFKAYLRSGVISVLMSSHIPGLLSEAFRRCLPARPWDEYPAARARRRKFVLHLGETNTGKTYHAVKRLLEVGEGAYLAPLRVLALENYEWMNAQGARCDLLTGEEEIRVEGARLISCTVEKLNLDRRYPLAVVDEAQLMADPQRGAAWVRAILGLNCPEIHLCGALTAREQLLRMIEDCGDDVEFHEYRRSVPLKIDWKPVDLDRIQPGDALIAFSRKRVIALSEYLAALGVPTAVIYGDLPPEVRRMQYAAFLRGEMRALVSTDAIGLGVNLPIRRIVFTELTKFDGQEMRPLTSQEVKQIAGRAGRLGIYDVGYVATTGQGHTFLESRLEAEDMPIEQAVVGPSEALLSVGILPLREKLALWSEREEEIPHYRKMDVRDQLLLLDAIAPFRLPEEVQWKLMMLPFNVHSEARMEQFLSYVEAHFLRRERALPRPERERQDLGYLEGHYQAINLYYAFSRAFGLKMDERWVEDARRSVGEAINRLLRKNKR